MDPATITLLITTGLTLLATIINALKDNLKCKSRCQGCEVDYEEDKKTVIREVSVDK